MPECENVPQEERDDGDLIDSAEPETKRNKNRPGRASRRRKQKLVDIQRAEDEIRGTCASASTADNNNNNNNSNNNNNNNGEKTLQLPVDRDRVWPAVTEQRTLKKWSTADEAELVAQLGYLPGNAIRISARTSYVPALMEVVKNGNLPVALQLYPIALRDEHAGGKQGRRFKARKRRQVEAKTEDPEDDDNSNNNTSNGNSNSNSNNKTDTDTTSSSSLIEPFPTLFWLTHPLLRVWISKLELDGLGSRLEQRLAACPKSSARMEQAHQAYGQERYQLLTPDDLILIQSRGWEAAFAPTRGVAGIRNHAAIKCLHAHAAHYLSEPEGQANNVIGEWVMQAVATLASQTKE
jgi:hypothetical protein